MAMREDFESSGAWLFRWRSYLPLFVIGLFVLALAHYHYLGRREEWDHVWEIFCLSVSFLGLGLSILVVGFTPKGTSGRNTKNQIADTLNTTGAYSLVRNPLYLGNYFMGLGLALFAHLWWLVLLYSAIFWLYYERIIFAEEAFLREKFGKIFLAWADVTPAFIPMLRGFRKPDLPFSLKNVLKREYNGFLAVMVTMFFLETVGDYFLDRKFEMDFVWGVLMAGSLALWVVLRIVRKHTTLLHTEGR